MNILLIKSIKINNSHIHNTAKITYKIVFKFMNKVIKISIMIIMKIINNMTQYFTRSLFVKFYKDNLNKL